MPSRRSFLLGGGGLAAIGGLGWFGVEHVSVTGEVKRKYIDVSWESNGRQQHGRILWSALSEDEINISYASSYAADAVQSPREITVAQGLDSRLNEDFSDVTYRIGVCGTAAGDCGYSMKRVSRDGFNSVQLSDTATVANFGNQLYVYEVNTESGWSGSSEIRTFEFTSKEPTYP